MRILLRCDGGPGTGVGHVVRCLALAQEALARGHSVDLLGQLDGDFLGALAREAGPELRLLGAAPDEDPGASARLADRARGYDLLHVDHYEVGEGLLADLSRFGPDRPVLSSLADGGYGARPADLLLDPTVDAQLNSPPAAARWHLRGQRYVALRRGLRELRDAAPRRGGEEPRVLVVMGGTDPLGCAPLVVDALAHTGLALDVTVVATPATAEALAARARSWPRGRLEVTPPISDLPAAMAQADLVVSAAGTSVWELCALARPMAVVAVVDNQLPGYAALLRAGAAAGLGRPDDLADPSAVAGVLRPLLEEPARRDELATAARTLVDGLGAWRVVSSWEQVVAGATPDAAPRSVAVRPATLDDAELLWRWRNDPATRRSSRVHDPVPLDAHLAWLRGSLERDDRHLLVGEQGTGEQGTVEVGTVRWDREHPGEWEVSITVAPDHRGQGLAGPLLGAGEDWLSGSLPSTGPLEGASQGGDGVAAYLAAVHVDNAASRTLFLHAGYLPDLPPDDAGFERFVKWARPGPT